MGSLFAARGPAVSSPARLDPQRGVTSPLGFRAASARCGLKSAGEDVALIVSDAPSAAAGVFTTNQVYAHCVGRGREVTARGEARAILVNAGNANACNGPHGAESDRRMAASAAALLGLPEEQVLTASTGVIGHPLPVERIEGAAPLLVSALSTGAEADARAAAAIMTTDLVPKLAAVEVDQPGARFRIGGICKGSGMIAPRLAPPHATMLCFLTTDAAIAPAPLRQALVEAVRVTFNRVTVDGDTSTNDMVLLLANGASGTHIQSEEGFALFGAALTELCAYLARSVARDGEGATKLVEVHVRGAETEEDAERAARAIAESPLVKTALFGNDPNWGRILAAAGRSGASLCPETASVAVGPVTVYAGGERAQYSAEEARRAISGEEVRITLDLGRGASEATFWTCDLSYDYVRINAEYHT